jgi:hypothetical protein
MSQPLRPDQIGTTGTTPGPAVRLVFDLAGPPDDRRLVPLHDDDVGTFATVYGGRSPGPFPVRLAVKVQRERSRNREHESVVAAKFDEEARMHAALTAGGNNGVVRYYDLTGSGAAADLAPTVLCWDAPHGLGPRCPAESCGRPLEPDPLADDGALVCVGCKARFGADSEYAVRKATVRRDPGCDGCPRRNGPADGCLPRTRFLTRLPAKLLAFERLDLDLSDYLRWATTPPVGRADAYAAYQSHRTEADADPSGLGAIGRVANLFLGVVDGARRLHRELDGGAHLDLKPENVCLRLTGRRATPKVIDLGVSADAAARERLSHLPVRPVSGEYTAPEVVRPRAEVRVVKAVRQGDVVWLLLPRGDAALDPVVAVGDRVELTGPDGTTVVSRVTQTASKPPGVWAATDLKPTGLPEVNRVTVLKHAGPAADLYSLGLMLVAVVSGRPQLPVVTERLEFLAVQAFRRADGTVHPELNGRPARAAVRRVTRAVSENPFLSPLADELARSVSRFPGAEPLAAELLGLGLRACVRGVPGWSFATDRGAGPEAVGPFREAVSRVAAAADRLAAVAAADAARGRLLDRLRALRALVPAGAGTTQAEAVGVVPAEVLVAALLDPTAERPYLTDLYGRNIERLRADLEAAERGLTRQADPPPLPPDPGLARVEQLARIAIAVQPDAAEYGRYADAVRKSADRSDRVRELADRLDRFAADIAAVRHFLRWLQATIEAGKVNGSVVSVTLRRADRDGVGYEPAAAALNNLAASPVNDLADIARRFAELRRELDRGRLNSFDQLMTAAERQLRAAGAEHDGWQARLRGRLHLARQVVEHGRAVVLDPWDQALGRPQTMWERMAGRRDPLTVAVDWGAVPGPQAGLGAAGLIAAEGLGPGFRVRMAFAIELRPRRLDASGVSG